MSLKEVCTMPAKGSEELSARAWYLMGRRGPGGAYINARYYTQQQCVEMALRFRPGDSAAWELLARIGGGTVEGKFYSVVDCWQQSVVTNFASVSPASPPAMSPALQGKSGNEDELQQVAQTAVS